MKITSTLFLFALLIVGTSCSGGGGGGGGGSSFSSSTSGSNSSNNSTPLDLSGGASFTVEEQDAITTIDINNGSSDLTAEGQAITYSCYYDINSVDGVVAAVNACSSLSGLTFNTSTGGFDWRPDGNSGNDAPTLYEFSIIGTYGSNTDSVIFTATVTDHTGVKIDPISDVSMSEGGNVVIDAGDGGDDTAGSTLGMTYTCTFNGGTNCSSLPGTVSFNASTGVLDWTPDYTAGATGTFTITITATDGTLVDDEVFVVTVAEGNQPPTLDAIGDETISENSAITTVNAADGGDDFDAESEAITYSCTFNSGTNCSSLPGAVTFTAGTGVLDWTPDYTAAATGTFNFTITGSDGSGSDDELFTITVNNTNRAPVLDAIGDETVNEGVAITTVNAGDGADDLDVDYEAITYTCTFNGGTNCTSLPGTISFAAATGILDWTPNYFAAATGTFTITINGSDGSLNDDEILVITVNDVAVGAVLDAIGNETVSEASAITQINAADGGDDIDGDGDTITYVCYYDKNSVDGTVASTNTCASLGATFNATTGVMDWTPTTSDGNGGPDQYEFRITGSATGGTGDKIFTITVNDLMETGFYKVTAGSNVACGLTAEGKAYCWGSNSSGEVGDTTQIQKTTPTAVSTSLSFVDINATYNTVCALTEGGDVYCWGNDTEGPLGNGAPFTLSTTLVQVDMSGHGTDNKFKVLAESSYNTMCGISIQGNVYCWGRGDNNTLGTGSVADTPTPTKVDFSAHSTDLRVLKVVGCREGFCALSHDGEVYCWGRNNSYETGLNSDGAVKATPVVGMNLSTSKYRDISGFEGGYCAITVSGAVECWGSGWGGELGDGAGGSTYSSLKTFVTTNLATNEYFRKLSGGNAHVCGVTNMGNIFCWGEANLCGTGASGTGATAPSAINIAGKSFFDVSAGALVTVAIASDGKAYAWGTGTSGQMGDGGTTARTSPVAVDMSNVVSGVSKLGFYKIDVKSDNSGSTSQVGITSNGSVFNLGTTTKVSMAAHSPDTGLMDIDAGADHSCALSAQGNAYCWGDNTNGELGDGSTTTSATPVKVDMSAFPTDARFIKISAGTNSSCGISSQGNTYCWGLNASGQLGDGTTTQSTSPVAVDISGLTGTKGKFVYINASGDNACAVNAEGEAYCWGDNSNGTIGDGTTTGPRLTPTIVSTTDMGTDTQIVTVHPASTHMCVLSSQGKIYCTGTADQIGDNAAIARTAPYPIDYSTIGTTYFTAAKTGTNNGCGLTVDGKIYCWGTNASGQIGDGSTATSLDPTLYDMVAFGSENLFSGLSVGDDRVCGSTPSGKLYCAGNGFSSSANYPNEVSQTLP